MDRYPRQLSGGQRQRVAMGRAMVRKPEVLLYDEPLSNLDLELRVRLRLEIAEMQKKLRTTAVYVTHDQSEAMTLADNVVVLRSGQIEQSGSPHDLYHRPANTFVAGFIGTPKMNFFDVLDASDSPEPEGTALNIGESTVILPGQLNRRPKKIGVRPEYCLIGETPHPDSVRIKLSEAHLVIQEHLGDRSFGYLKSAEGSFTYLMNEDSPPPAGGAMALT